MHTSKMKIDRHHFEINLFSLFTNLSIPPASPFTSSHSLPSFSSPPSLCLPSGLSPSPLRCVKHILVVSKQHFTQVYTSTIQQNRGGSGRNLQNGPVACVYAEMLAEINWNRRWPHFFFLSFFLSLFLSVSLSFL